MTGAVMASIVRPAVNMAAARKTGANGLLFMIALSIVKRCGVHIGALSFIRDSIGGARR